MPRAEDALLSWAKCDLQAKRTHADSLGFSLETSHTAQSLSFLLHPCPLWLWLLLVIFLHPGLMGEIKGLWIQVRVLFIWMFTEGFPRAVVLNMYVCAGLLRIRWKLWTLFSDKHSYISILFWKQNWDPSIGPWLRTSLEVDQKVSFLVFPSLQFSSHARTEKSRASSP